MSMRSIPCYDLDVKKQVTGTGEILVDLSGTGRERP